MTDSSLEQSPEDMLAFLEKKRLTFGEFYDFVSNVCVTGQEIPRLHNEILQAFTEAQKKFEQKISKSFEKRFREHLYFQKTSRQL